MKIVVLGGGISTERQISLDSSLAILKALRTNGHKAVFVDLFLGIENSHQSLQSLFDSRDGLIEDLERSRSLSFQQLQELYCTRNGCVIGPRVMEICMCADFVFLGLHGECGEDGKIQGMLDLLGIPYNGSGALGSAMAMNKEIARKIMQNSGICIPELVNNAPCVVKPISGGSSIGVKLCRTDNELKEALSDAENDKDSILIERFVEGTEVSVGVLGNRALAPIALIPPKGHILDFAAKYSDGNESKKIICPAPIDEAVTRQIQEIAEKLHKAMKLEVYSRADFMIDRNNNIWCLEVNTLPGMTEHSALPIEAACKGISYNDLCEMIIKLSLDKYSYSLIRKIPDEPVY